MRELENEKILLVYSTLAKVVARKEVYN